MLQSDIHILHSIPDDSRGCSPLHYRFHWTTHTHAKHNHSYWCTYLGSLCFLLHCVWVACLRASQGRRSLPCVALRTGRGCESPTVTWSGSRNSHSCPCKWVRDNPSSASCHLSLSPGLDTSVSCFCQHVPHPFLLYFLATRERQCWVCAWACTQEDRKSVV